MPKADEDLTKHTLNLFPGDYDRLRELFPDVGAGPIIRRLVREFIAKTDGASTGAANLKEKVNL